MPNLAKHLDALQPSATLAINSQARKLRSSGKKIWNFSVGEPDYPCPQEIIEAALTSIGQDPIRYGSAGGGLALREAIQHKLKKENNLSYDMDQIVCGTGAKQVLYHLMHSLFDPGDELLIHTPCWTSYKEQLTSARGKLITMPFVSEKPFDPEYIEQFVTTNTKALLLCSPNNPAGYVIAHQQLEILADYLKEKDWWIISDEIYEYYSFSGKHRSIIDYAPELADRYIHINGVSKSFAMTGWRMGYLAGPKHVAKRVKTLISHSSTCLPIFVEKAAEVAIKAGSTLMKGYQQTLRTRKALATELASTMDHIHYIDPQGAFYLFMNIKELLTRCHPSKGYQPTDSLKLCSHLLEHFHVSTVAGEAFLCPGYLRLSYAADKNDLKEGMSRMAECFHNLLK
ncbi:MAG: aminotransferase class I/II-fold pyridoxal phosphate-dependent enzyme [Proteobacteria bacterium]|nr:aminotransferase class I/II-fold pyridoxal phosphate-dependent enzyme [Pseudomonadota bacterium]